MFGDAPWYQLEVWQMAVAIGLHFCLGFLVAVSVFCLTSTILSHYSLVLKIQDSFILWFSLLFALSFSVLVHIWQDYYLRLF
jgi:hypothetical protein